MEDYLESSVFGKLEVDTELLDHPLYSKEVEVAGHGPIEVSLCALEDNPDWSELLRNAEAFFPILLEQEAAIRQQASPQILSRHQRRYSAEWTGSAADLITFLRLENINFFSNGTSELWYFGGAPFCHNDIFIGLDADMRVVDVGLDG